MPKRALPFVLAASNFGTMIVNHLDEHKSSNGSYGVGWQILQNGSFDENEINTCLGILNLRKQYFGDGVFVLDCGANIGVHAINFAKHLESLGGGVLSFEAQERIYYALAGNIALNNCFNARAIHAALANPSKKGESLEFLTPDYTKNASFGSLELKQNQNSEFIGQELSRKEKVPLLKLDFFDFERVDFIKIDVEGMEFQLLKGGIKCLEKHKPILQVEIIKSDLKEIKTLLLKLGYKIFEAGINILAIHESDPSLNHIKSS